MRAPRDRCDPPTRQEQRPRRSPLCAGFSKAGLAWLAVAMACAQTQNPFANDPSAPEAGRGIFRIYCSPCHGLKAEGGRGPDLTRGTFSAGNTDEDLFQVISGGAQGTEMPAFGDRFGNDNIWKLVAFIRSVQQRGQGRAPAGDVEAGRKLFWGKGGCGQCHRAEGRGGRIGPDLSRVGRERSYAYIRRGVLEPDADLTPGYYAITVVTHDGRTIQGVQRGFDNFSAQFLDLGERYHSYWREDVASMKREFRSIMPGNYGKLFRAGELNDLLAYLASLRGEGKAQ